MDIRCTDSQGHGCGKLLGKVDGPALTIVCPRCGQLHRVSILALVEELTAYLAEIEATAAKASGRGFML